MAMYGDDEILYPIDDENMEVYLPFSSLTNQNYKGDSDDDEKFLAENLVISEKENKSDLKSYYCAICGQTCLVINTKLEKLPVRLTDGTYSIG